MCQGIVWGGQACRPARCIPDYALKRRRPLSDRCSQGIRPCCKAYLDSSRMVSSSPLSDSVPRPSGPACGPCHKEDLPACLQLPTACVCDLDKHDWSF